MLRMVMSSIRRCRSGVIACLVIGVLLPVGLRERAILTGRSPATSARKRLNVGELILCDVSETALLSRSPPLAAIGGLREVQSARCSTNRKNLAYITISICQRPQPVSLICSIRFQHAISARSWKNLMNAKRPCKFCLHRSIATRWGLISFSQDQAVSTAPSLKQRVAIK